MNDTWMWGPFGRVPGANPLLGPGDGSFSCPFSGHVHWEDLGIFNPAAVVRDGKVFILYRAAGSEGFKTGISRLGLACSEDGLHFSRLGTPVLYPEKGAWQDLEFGTGLQDPRLVQREDGSFLLTYAMFDEHNCYMAVASSPDLIHWQKHGLAFEQALDGRYRDTWSKAGAIVCRRQGDKMLAVRIHGKYWMYWGESDIYAATSDDLIHWTPVEMEVEGKKRLTLVDGMWRDNWQPGHPVLRPVLQPRSGRFDSVLVEPGPPALLTEDGILLIYNGCNAGGNHGDPNLPAGAYSAGQVLFDPHDPTAVLARCEAPFLTPQMDFERQGTIPNVTFANGMIFFKQRWWLYYGATDRYIGVAVTPPDENPLENPLAQ